jgi:hypothetical protein
VLEPALSAVKVRGGHEREDLHRFEPLPAGHSHLERHCLICWRQFAEGDQVTLLPLGPGNHPERQRAARMHRWYSALAIVVHADCAGVPQAAPDAHFGPVT